MATENDSNQTPSLKGSLLLFRSIGSYTKQKTILSYVTITSMFFVIAFMLSDFVLNVNSIESLRRITFLPSFFVSAIKGFFMIINSNQLIDIVQDLQKFWRPNKFDKETEKKIQLFIRKISLICGTYSFCGFAVCLLMSIMPFLDFESRSLVFNDFTFCNLQNLSCWIPMYIWQFTAMMFQLLPVVVGFDCLFFTLVGYIMVACKLIKVALYKLNTDNLQKRRYILKEIVTQHDFMMTFLNALNDMYTIVMLLQFWCSLWSMILMLNMMVANGLPPKAADVSYFGTLYAIIFFQIFLYSTGGAIVEDRVQKVDTDMYSVNWYGRNRTDMRKDLALMIFRPHRTKILNAGKMSDLNYTLLIATLKNSMSVVTLIWQLANQ